MVWQIIGIMIQKFNNIFAQYAEEIKRIMLMTIDKEFSSKNPDLGNLVGCLKGLSKFIKVIELTDEESKIIRKETFFLDIHRNALDKGRYSVRSGA
jgi:hypothetical protein